MSYRSCLLTLCFICQFIEVLHAQHDIWTPSPEVVALLEQGAAQRSKPEISEDFAARALKLAEVARDQAGMAGAYRLFGSLALDHNEFEVALTNFSEALHLYGQIDFPEKIAAVYNDLGIAYMNKGDFAEATRYLGLSLSIDRQRRDTAGIAGSLTNIADLYHKQGDIKTAIIYLDSVRLFDSLMGDWNYYLQDIGNLSQMYNRIGDVNNALRYATEGFFIAERGENTEGIYINAATIGQAYISLKELVDAV